MYTANKHKLREISYFLHCVFCWISQSFMIIRCKVERTKEKIDYTLLIFNWFDKILKEKKMNINHIFQKLNVFARKPWGFLKVTCLKGEKVTPIIFFTLSTHLLHLVKYLFHDRSLLIYSSVIRLKCLTIIQ